MRRRFFTVPGSRTMFTLIVLLALAVVSLGITVFADEAVIEEAAEAVAEEATEAAAETVEVIEETVIEVADTQAE